MPLFRPFPIHFGVVTKIRLKKQRVIRFALSYSSQVEENCQVPLELLALNVSDEHRDKLGNMKFSIAPNEHNEYFTVDSYNGSLYLVVSPDREQIGELTVTVRVDKISRRGKTLQMIYPLGPESLNTLGKLEDMVINTKVKF